MLKLIETSRPNVFSGTSNMYNNQQKYGKNSSSLWCSPFLSTHIHHIFHTRHLCKKNFRPTPNWLNTFIICLNFKILERLSLNVCFLCLFFFLFFLVNPIASSHIQNAQQQNLTSQNYSLHPNNNNSTNVQAMQMTNHHHYDASSFNSSSNNFNHNFDPSNQSFQYQQQNYEQTTAIVAQTYEGGSHMTQQQQQIYQSTQQQAQFYGQSATMMGQASTTAIHHQNHTQGLNNGPTSTYQHTINDLLVQHPTSSYQQQPQQQTLYNNQVQTNQSVRF